MIEKWKCDVCGVWEGCALSQLIGRDAPVNCVRYKDREAKWTLRKEKGYKVVDRG